VFFLCKLFPILFLTLTNKKIEGYYATATITSSTAPNANILIPKADSLQVRMLIDTGATFCCVDKKVTDTFYLDLSNVTTFSNIGCAFDSQKQISEGLVRITINGTKPSDNPLIREIRVANIGTYNIIGLDFIHRGVQFHINGDEGVGSITWQKNFKKFLKKKKNNKLF